MSAGSVCTEAPLKEILSGLINEYWAAPEVRASYRTLRAPIGLATPAFDQELDPMISVRIGGLIAATRFQHQSSWDDGHRQQPNPRNQEQPELLRQISALPMAAERSSADVVALAIFESEGSRTTLGSDL